MIDTRWMEMSYNKYAPKTQHERMNYEYEIDNNIDNYDDEYIDDVQEELESEGE